MAGNECTPRSPSQFFFPRGESFGNYTAKTVGRTDGGASRVHYITCVNCATGAGRANDRAVGRNYCPGLGAGEIAVQEYGGGNQVQAVQRQPRPVMLGCVLSLAAGEATRFSLSSSSVSVTFFTVSASESGTG